MLLPGQHGHTSLGKAVWEEGWAWRRAMEHCCLFRDGWMRRNMLCLPSCRRWLHQRGPSASTWMGLSHPPHPPFSSAVTADALNDLPVQFGLHIFQGPFRCCSDSDLASALQSPVLSLPLPCSSALSCPCWDEWCWDALPVPTMTPSSCWPSGSDTGHDDVQQSPLRKDDVKQHFCSGGLHIHFASENLC